ncbi:MAG: glycerol-3-phosphate dehydrogenase [Gammaproteobacteria bacterium]
MEDLLIIGGGINGVGIAADAAGRGLKVTLCEKADLASGTSSASSKLIHGGLRYLQQGEFRLVREALKEREILWAKAPHIIHPELFILPYVETLHPLWQIRLGLWLYDHLGGRQRLPKSHMLDLIQHPAGSILQSKYNKGFSYIDCYVDDARLVVLNAIQAQQLGAKILTYTEMLQAQRYADYWRVLVRSKNTGKEQWLETRILINAAGPWVQEVLHDRIGIKPHYQTILVKGSHIVVPRFFKENFAFTLQNEDGRVIFVIPFDERFILIGTTEVGYQGDPANATISPEEIAYLCTAVNRYFSHQIQIQDVIWSYAGVRPLQGTEQQQLGKVSRDYKLELNTAQRHAPLLSIFGGKITTYRRLAEHVLKLLQTYFPHMGPEWTAATPLPGGDIKGANFENFCQQFSTKYSWLPPSLAYRYAHSYGTRAALFLKNAQSIADLGQPIAMGLYQQEIQYLVENEWALTADDILWRRTKLGLLFSKTDKNNLIKYLTQMLPANTFLD